MNFPARDYNLLQSNEETVWEWLVHEHLDFPEFSLIARINGDMTKGFADCADCGRLREKEVQMIFRPPGVARRKEYTTPLVEELQEKFESFSKVGKQLFDDIPYPEDEIGKTEFDDANFRAAVLPFIAFVHHGLYFLQLFGNGNKRTAAIMTNFLVFGFFPEVFIRCKQDSGSGLCLVKVNASEAKGGLYNSFLKKSWTDRSVAPFCAYLNGRINSANNEVPCPEFPSLKEHFEIFTSDLVHAR